MAETDVVVGCDYCRDPANPLIDGLAGDGMKLLLECPRCGQYYGIYGFEPHYRPALTEAGAAEYFPEAFRFGRPKPEIEPSFAPDCRISQTSSDLAAFPPAWRTDTAVSLARQMYELGDFSLMPILADALQDAGCDNDELLNHCRGPGPHVRGCWVVDLVRGKESGVNVESRARRST